MLGFVGLVAYLVICGAAILGPLVWSWREQSVAAWWWCLVIVFLVVQNLTESFVLWQSYIWVLFLAAALAPFGTASRPHSRFEPADSIRVQSIDEEVADTTEPATRIAIDDVWTGSASSIAELMPAGDLEI